MRRFPERARNPVNQHWRQANSIFPVVTLALLILGVGLQAAPAQSDDELASLSASSIIGLLRNEPGLLLEAKKSLVKAAASEGRLLDEQDLTDDALYTLIREDASVRALITREIEERRYVQVKPTRSELESGMVFACKRPDKGEAQAGESSRQASQEETYWASHERVLEHFPEPNAAETAASAQEAPVAPSVEIPASAAPPAYSSPRSVPPPERQWELNPRRQVESAAAQLPGGGFSRTVPGAAEAMARIQPEELPALVNASLMDKPPLDVGRLGSARSAEGAGLDPLASQTPSTFPSTNDFSSSFSQTLSEQARNNVNPARVMPLAASSLRQRQEQEKEPTLQYRTNPYADVPSLYDLYAQYPGSGPALERFGTEIFRNGTGNFDELPMDLPVGPEYVLGPGDGLSIELYGGISERLERVVDRTGRVALPEVGTLEVSGRNLGEVQRAVQSVLRTQFRDVQADVSLSRLRTVRVYVVGDVERPGAYDISALSTPLNALYLAGGPTARGSLRLLRHYRGQQLVEQTDVYDLLLQGIRTGVAGLEPGDTILVPPLGPQVTVEGMVRRPEIYELNGEKSLAEVLALAGGVLPSGTLRHVDVERVEAHLARTMLRLDIPEDNNRESVGKALEKFRVEDGDRIKISPILPYSDKAVYLAGHVVRPGKFAYRDGMKFTDIVKSYSDLMPEPYKRHAEIVRLSPPDYTPAVLAFNLDEALAGGNRDIALKPFDTIRIFGRFDFEDQPMVTVSGEVRHPGNHVTNGATRLRDAVYLAGGATRDAQLEDAQVFRRRENGRLEVISVNLTRALAGDERDNILLEPKDQLFIHKSPAKADPTSVKVEGEIARPGKYPLGEGMTAADLVRLAGGLKRGADTEAADLTRYEVGRGNSVTGEHLAVPIARALAGEPGADLNLRDGDVLTVRQIAGWNDLGATIAVRGEVLHPGAYGIKEGERLSSILARAGGFRDGAYPYGAIFERAEVRELEERNRAQLLSELQSEGMALKGAPVEGDDKPVKDASVLQWKTTVEKLENTPPSGRLVVHISKDVRRWANTPADIEVRAGDRIYIPKRPGVVVVDGAVFHSTAVAFRPGKSAGWYLRQAGGPSNSANRKAIFVVRADGSVVGGPGGMFSGGVESAQLFAGDTVVVPEKAFSGTTRFKNAFQVSQIVEAAAIAATVGKSF